VHNAFGVLCGCLCSANTGPSDHASTEDDSFARFPVSGHGIGGTHFSRLIGSNAATAAGGAEFLADGRRPQAGTDTT
jgi:hypothetical protein